MVIAYFSMEIALEDGLKNYAGGLGILAGDILKSAADLDLPFVGLTLLNNHGYFEQKVNENGVQSALPIAADRSQLSKLSVQTKIKIGDEEVTIGAWQYVVKGQGGATVPVYFLDTNLPENKEEFRSLTDYLYGGDQEYRLQQEIILGEGGVALLNALHYEVARYHLNEGHSALAALSLFLSSKAGPTSEKIAEVRRQCVFTTHTSVQAAQDIFPKELFFKYQAAFPAELSELINNNQINLTELGVFLSGSLNAVSNLHQKVVAEIFRERAVAVVTNGVHSVAWTAPEYKKLYDKYLPGWREKNDILKEAIKIPLAEIYDAHAIEKKRLFAYIEKAQDLKLDEGALTIGFARRMVMYKQATLLLSDPGRLLNIQNKFGRLQIIYAGKAHPQDEEGQQIIKDIYNFKKKYAGQLEIVFLENYEIPLAKLLSSGVDLWLNTSLPSNEASGTSGMKAAHNGVPQLSTFDGWWGEGYVPGQTGWLINEQRKIYDVLEQEILPLYYQAPEKWTELCRSTISLNASRFNTERVVKQYMSDIYKLDINNK